MAHTIIQIQFASWDKKHNIEAREIEPNLGNEIIVETDSGEDIAKVVGKQSQNSVELDENIKSISRIATPQDQERKASNSEKKEFFQIAKELIHKHELPMKLVDVAISLDRKKLNFAFIAEGRVDFRNLVKELTSRCKASVRLTQIGIRDEAKFTGDCGPCGRILCCKKFIKEFNSITSEMAETQQVVHRGNERISGMCNRLMCCLAYEQKGYKEMSEKMPKMGEKVKLQGYKGEVIGLNLLKQTVQLKLEEKNNEENGATVVEIDLKKK